jgi:hypothetical protein
VGITCGYSQLQQLGTRPHSFISGKTKIGSCLQCEEYLQLVRVWQTGNTVGSGQHMSAPSTSRIQHIRTVVFFYLANANGEVLFMVAFIKKHLCSTEQKIQEEHYVIDVVFASLFSFFNSFFSLFARS